MVLNRSLIRHSGRSSSTRSAISTLGKMALSASPVGRYYNAAKSVWHVGKVGKKLFNAATRSTKRKYNVSKKPASRGSSKWNNTSTGIYAGKFKRPRKAKKGIFTTALQKGYKLDVEEYGRVEDPDTAYLGHSTKHILNYATALTGALLRRLFAKAGYPIADRFDELSLFSYNNSDGFKIEFIIKNPLDMTESLQTTVITVDNNSFQGLMGGVGVGTVGNFIQHVVNYITQVSTLEPFKVILYASDRNVAETNWRMCACINVQYERIHMLSTSVLTVQNRTAGANAGATEKSVDRVDNQPLEGWLYEFNQATPRLKFLNQNSSTMGPFNTMPTNGLNLVRAAQLADNALQNAPDSKMWSNCTKKSKIMLQPGNMKRTVIVHKHECSVLTFLYRIRNIATQGASMIGGSGKSQLLCFTESLRTQSSNPVTIQYERHIQVGCYLVGTKTPPIKANLLVGEVNNIP